MKQSNIFKCKTPNAFQFKILIELLSVSLSKVSFRIKDDGIDMMSIDNNHNKIFNVHLDKYYFDIYKFNSDETIDIGVTLSNLHKMLKSIKKKDILELFVNTENTRKLGIRTIPSMIKNLRTTTTELIIQNIQTINIDMPKAYDKHIVVLSNQFQSMCKDLRNVGGTNIKVVSSGFTISFSCDADSVMTRTVEFGDPNESDSEDDKPYTQTFPIEQFTSIQKISGLSDKLYIYPKEGLPLYIKASMGIGNTSLDIYMYSNELKTSMSEMTDSDSDE